jgi:hypothetical protein
MQPRSFISGGDGFGGDVLLGRVGEAFGGLPDAVLVMLIGRLEKASGMGVGTPWAVVFHRKEVVGGRGVIRIGITIFVTALRAEDAISSTRLFDT